MRQNKSTCIKLVLRIFVLFIFFSIPLWSQTGSLLKIINETRLNSIGEKDIQIINPIEGKDYKVGDTVKIEWKFGNYIPQQIIVSAVVDKNSYYLVQTIIPPEKTFLDWRIPEKLEEFEMSTNLSGKKITIVIREYNLMDYADSVKINISGPPVAIIEKERNKLISRFNNYPTNSVKLNGRNLKITNLKK